ncbi:hypothetical protein EVAR_46690_1 [Eumeta japonica]|uniref:Uncharacterized protein n=1 Tax=Eumeta variegata TaxID=151549 RepID=A0A4C1Y6X4_EUMVA|nr:hypothetical protein EVAR_46690_1 [Eumeta japonica]
MSVESPVDSWGSTWTTLGNTGLKGDVSSLDYLMYLFMSHAGVRLYVWEDVCCRYLVSLEVRYLGILWVCVDCDYDICIFAWFYRFHNDPIRWAVLLTHSLRGENQRENAVFGTISQRTRMVCASSLRHINEGVCFESDNSNALSNAIDHGLT